MSLDVLLEDKVKKRLKFIELVGAREMNEKKYQELIDVIFSEQIKEARNLIRPDEQQASVALQAFRSVVGEIIKLHFPKTSEEFYAVWDKFFPETFADENPSA